MKKEIISDKQGINIVALYLMGSTLVLGTAKGAEKDAWIAFTIAIAAALPLLLIYSRLNSDFQGNNLADIIQLGFGKIIGSLIIILYTWFAFHLGAIVMRDFGEFIITVGLPETPMLVPMIILAALCAWVVKEGIEVLGRWSELFFPILILLIALTTLLLIPKIDLNRLQPMLYKGWGPVLAGAYSSYSFPFGDAMLFLFVLGAVKRKNSSYKAYLIGALVASAAILSISIRNIAVLGEYQFASAYFPSYLAARRIDIGNFIQRLEIFVTLAFIIAGFVKISICILVTSRNISKVLGFKDYRFIVIPVTMLMVILSAILYHSTMEAFEWGFEVSTYYAFPFQTVLPVITLVVLEIRRRSPKFKKKLKALNKA